MQSTSFSAGNLHTYRREFCHNFFPLTKQSSAVIKQLIKLVILTFYGGNYAACGSYEGKSY